jgi:hypothetical protein
VPKVNLTEDELTKDADYDRWFDAKVQASMDGVQDGTNRKGSNVPEWFTPEISYFPTQ